VFAQQAPDSTLLTVDRIYGGSESFEVRDSRRW